MPTRFGRASAVAALCVVLQTVSTPVRCEILSPTRYWRNTFQGETASYATEAEALAGGAAAYCAHPSNAILAGCVYAGGGVINVQMVVNGPWAPVNLIDGTKVKWPEQKCSKPSRSSWP